MLQEEDSHQPGLAAEKPHKIERQFWRDPYFYLTIALAMILSIPIFIFRILKPVDGDFAAHIEFAKTLVETGTMPRSALSHPLLQILLIFFHKLSFEQLGYYAITFGLMIVSEGLLAGIVYSYLGERPQPRWKVFRTLISLSLVFIAPPMLFIFLDRLFYIGYIGLANYHNPTVIMLRPFALLIFILSLNIFKKDKRSIKDYVSLALLIVLSALLKPNFLLVFLPVYGLVCVYLWLKTRELDLKFAIFAVLMPGFLILLAQYLITYQSGAYQSQIILAPLKVVAMYSAFWFGKLLLSSLFVLAASYILWPWLSSDPGNWTFLFVYVTALLQMYLLAETGKEMYAGNFFWGAQVALLISIVYLVKKAVDVYYSAKGLPIFQSYLLAGIYLLYVGAGIAYYLKNLLDSSYM